jgi:hypothetical protein
VIEDGQVSTVTGGVTSHDVMLIFIVPVFERTPDPSAIR